jgi:SulP family sulfate permease
LPDRERLRRIPIAVALRRALAQGYSARDLRADVLAGLVVGIVALPLSMALAVAVGVPPQHGLYTAIVAGSIVALLGGSKWQVTGPTAAFVVILAPIVSRYGLGGLLVATLLGGVLQVLFGILRFGRLIQLVPYPVTIGFTAGIAVVIGTFQVKDLLGLTLASRPEHYFEHVAALAGALPTLRWTECAVGVGTLFVLNAWPRITTRVPAPLVALAGAAVVAWLLDLDVTTIRDRFEFVSADGVGRGIPQVPPLPLLPWLLPLSSDGSAALTFGLVRDLLPAAFAIAILGSIESLLSAVVADAMTGESHDPDAELLAQGLGNVITPFFGGIAATGAIARTATNVRAGARSPLAAFVHAGFVLAAVLALAPALGYMPMASLAAMLLLVAWNMAEVRHVAIAVRTSPRSDTLVLLTCFVLTVVFDMVIAVGAGLVLASLLFMRRMIEVSDVKLSSPHSHGPSGPGAPHWMVWYEIAGPLFFGAAHRAMSTLHRSRSDARVIVIDLSAVPVIDATGLVNLRSALSRLHRDGLVVVLAGARPRVREVLERAGLRAERGRLILSETTDEAFARALEAGAEQGLVAPTSEGAA